MKNTLDETPPRRFEYELEERVKPARRCATIDITMSELAEMLRKAYPDDISEGETVVWVTQFGDRVSVGLRKVEE